MLKERNELQEVVVTEDVICNKCGHSCRVADETLESDDVFNGVEIVIHWGYFSSKDLQSHRSHLCETCYDELVTSFVIPPEVREHGPWLDLDPFDV